MRGLDGHGLMQAPHVRAAPLVAALAGWVAGTALQLRQAALWSPGAYAALAGVALALMGLLWAWARWRQRRTGWLGVCLCVALLAYASVGWRAAQRPQLAPHLQGRDVVLQGALHGLPQAVDGGWRFQLDVQHAWLDGVPVALPPRVQLGWYTRSGEAATAADDAPGGAADGASATVPTAPASPAAPALRAGDVWRLTARLKRVHGQANPHGFDYELWQWSQGVAATGYVRTGRSAAAPVRLAQGQGAWWSRVRQRVRDDIAARPAPGLPADEAQRLAGVVAALVMGDQRTIEHEDWQVLRTTGVAHLMAISGLHITMFAWLAVAVLGRVWRRMARWRWPARGNPCLWLPAPQAALLGGVALAGAYALFSGWGVPAQRTVWMLTTLALLRLSGLRWPWWLGWLLAGAVVLALDPWALLQAGFWLSFVAVGVLFASAAGQGGDEGAPGGDAPRPLAFARRLWREQWVVTLALTPLSLLLFGQASVVGLVANLIAIPWVTLLVTPLALLGVLWPPLWQAAAWALAPLMGWLQWLSGWPWASVALPAAPWAVGALALAGGAWLAMPWPWRVRAAGLPLVLPLLLWQPARPAPGQFELLVLDVGQGSAVLVRTARHALLYDAGPRYGPRSEAGTRVLLPVLRALGVRPDVLLLSHGDGDHAGGAAALLAAYPDMGWQSSLPTDHPLHAQRPATRCQAGQGWVWDGVAFELLHPQAQDYDTHTDDNALSCVLRVRAAADAQGQGGHGPAALLTGDIAAAQERALLARQGPQGLRADVLLVPHHGSRASSSSAFVRAVSPRWALVQAGYLNRFHHPAPQVTARYQAQGAALRTTAQCGAMRWQSARPDALHCQREREARYYRAPPEQDTPLSD